MATGFFEVTMHASRSECAPVSRHHFVRARFQAKDISAQPEGEMHRPEQPIPFRQQQSVLPIPVLASFALTHEKP